MEEEQSDVGSGGTEHLPESMDAENQVEESYEEGDVGEIMVEIVGSDVFVNGVSSQIGDLEGNEWENREGNGSQSMDVWVGSRMVDSEVGFSESKTNGVLGEEGSDGFLQPELLNSSVEAVVEGKFRSLERDESLPSTGDDVDLSNGGVGGELGFVNVTKDGVLMDEVFRADLDRGVEAKIVDENKVFVAESGDSIVETEAVGTGDGIEHAFKTDELKLSNEEKAKNASLVRTYQPGYLSPPETEGPFGESDLVWGELRNHPWWPGQIFDEADASEKALKCYKKDSYLVAYFGDQTFAWNDSSVLKPFRSHFPQVEKQSNTKGLQSAVDSALEEVSRRVELGLACSCIPKDAYIRIGTQVIDNIGIREESRRRCGVSHSTRATLFEPNKLLDYVSNLAPFASSGADLIDLAIARAQLSAYYRYKGYRLELLVNEVASVKKRHISIEGSHPRKERSSTEIMSESPDAEDLGKSVSLSFERKRKAVDPLGSGLDKRVNTHAAKPFFEIGKCVSRVASQLTGHTLLLKGNDEEMAFDGSPEQTIAVSVESFSVNGMLLQLRLVAKDPKKRPNIENGVHAFFLGFRNSIVSHRSDKKGQAELTAGGDFEFDDANDTFWKQRNHCGGQRRIIQSYSAEQLRQEWENRIVNLQPVSLGAEKSVKTGNKSRSRKRFSSGSYPVAATGPDDSIKRRKQESSPAELILNFADRKCVPPEINLNKIFRRFGMLMESETEVDYESGVAKVIFKRGADAEVALSSAEKFNIFGPVLVKYQIGYTPLISVKISPLELPQFTEKEALML